MLYADCAIPSRSRSAGRTPACRPAAVAAGLSDRLAAGPVRRAAGLREVPGADEPGVRHSASSGSAFRTGLAARAAAHCLRRIASLSSICRWRHARSFNYPAQHDDCILIATAPMRSSLAYSQKCTHLSCAVVPRRAKA